jgi:hypothetical protein
MKAITAERRAGLQLLLNLSTRDCLVTSERFREDQVLLMITPPVDMAALDWDSVLYQGQKLKISSNGAFNAYDASTYKTPMRFMDDDMDAFIALVVHSERAPICAVLQNDINGDGFFYSLREYACIIPDTFDPSAERGQEALMAAGIASEDDQLTDVLTRLGAVDGRRVSPLGQFTKMFLRKRAITERRPVDGEDHEVDFTGELSIANAAQREAIRNAHGYFASLVHGPPGCAKTTTQVLIAESILVRNPDDKIIICAPSNEAANAIAYSFSQRQGRTGFHFKHARFLSVVGAESEMYHQPNHPLNDCLFHMKCYRWARAYIGPSVSVGAFINGFEEIQRTGNLGRNISRKHYNSQRKFVASEVMKEINIVITTCVHSGMKWLADSFDARWLMGDEVPSGHTYEFIIPLMAFSRTLERIIFAGDHKQLGAYFTTSEGAAAWSQSFFQNMVEDGLPCVLLNINYRTHPGLCLHTGSIFYDNQLSTSRQELGQFGTRLLHHLRDLHVIDANGRATALTTFAHFLDVTNSTFQTTSGGSSFSTPELSLIRATVKALVFTGVCDLNHIMLLSGYRAMCSKIREDAREGGWDPRHLEATADVRTVHSAQGSEKRVIILNLTKSGRPLQTSSMCGPRLVNVATSRMHDMLIVIGHWDSVAALPHDNKLRQTLMCLKDNIPDFLLPVGEAPFHLQDEAAIAAGNPPNQLTRQFIQVAREHHAEVPRDDLVLELEWDMYRLNSPLDPTLALYVNSHFWWSNRILFFHHNINVANWNWSRRQLL